MRPSPDGWGEFPCIECGKRAAGVPPGERCPECRWKREARAIRIARGLSLVAVLGYAAWVLLARPGAPAWLVAGGAPVMYLVVRFTAGRLAMEMLP